MTINTSYRVPTSAAFRQVVPEQRRGDDPPPSFVVPPTPVPNAEPARRSPQARVAQWRPRAATASQQRASRVRRTIPYLTFAFELIVMIAVVFAALATRSEVLARYDISVNGVGTEIGLGIQLVVVLMVWAASLVVVGAYSQTQCLADFREYVHLINGTAIAVSVVGFAAYVSDIEVSRGLLLFTLLYGIPALLLARRFERALIARARTRGFMATPAVVIGSADSAARVHALLGREAWTGYRVVGAVTAHPEESDGDYPVDVLGCVNDIDTIVRDAGVGAVIVAGRSTAGPEHLRRIGWALEGMDVELLVAPSLVDVARSRIRMRNVAGLPLLQVAEPSARSAQAIVKRTFSVIFAFILLLILAPAMMIIAAAIKLTDRGPVFFRQERIGVNGRPFQMLKFRSMVVDAEARLTELLDESDGNEVLFKMRNDPRVTRIGHFIRRYSLDELPQLINVVKSDMTLVGPRPALAYELDAYPEEVTRRLLVPPGITGLWQVSGRSDLSWEDSVRLDLYYVDNWSLTADVVIMCKTIKAVLKGAGAY